MFWSFAHDVSERAAKKWNQDINGLENLAWTELCKIDQITAIPQKSLFRSNSSLPSKLCV